MKTKIGIVGAAMLLGGLLGYFWLQGAATRGGWYGNTHASVDVAGIVEYFAIVSAIWSAVTIGTWVYALITPRVSRVVACVSFAYLCFMALWTVAGAGGSIGSFSLSNWFVATWQMLAPAVLGAILSIATVFAKRLVSKRRNQVAQAVSL